MSVDMCLNIIAKDELENLSRQWELHGPHRVPKGSYSKDDMIPVMGNLDEEMADAHEALPVEDDDITPADC